MIPSNPTTSSSSSQQPYVAAGCRIERSNYMVFPFGGFGLTFSKGSLQRLTRPIFLSLPPTNEWDRHVQFMLQERNAIYERDSFQEGMNLAQLIYEYTKEERFQDVGSNNWTRGFCFHGDHFYAYWVIYYKLGTDHPKTLRESMLHALQNSENHPYRTST